MAATIEGNLEIEARKECEDTHDEEAAAVQSSESAVRSYEFDQEKFRDVSDDDDSMLDHPIHVTDSDDDSEAEFNKILDLCDQLRRRRTRRFAPIQIEHEYDLLPKIEQLSIHVNDDIPLEPIGKVVDIIDRLVIIDSESCVALNFDTVLFNVNRDAIGQIFDVIGSVSKPRYAVRFNTPQEANQFEAGFPVYYAPTSGAFTHTIFPNDLSEEKLGDDVWDGEGECPSDQLAFSDDEAEKNYFRKQASKTRKNVRGESFGPRVSKKRGCKRNAFNQFDYDPQSSTQGFVPHARNSHEHNSWNRMHPCQTQNPPSHNASGVYSQLQQSPHLQDFPFHSQANSDHHAPFFNYRPHAGRSGSYRFQGPWFSRQQYSRVSKHSVRRRGPF